jgi:hypothetical protein
VRTFPPTLVCGQIALRRGSPKRRRRDSGRPGGLHYIGERGIHERIRRSGSDTGPDNCQEIVSEIRE